MSPLIAHACQVWGIKQSALLGKRKVKQLARARQVLAWFAVKHYGLSYSQVARDMNRDHTTIFHGVQVIGRELDAGDWLTCDLWNAFNHRKPVACFDPPEPFIPGVSLSISPDAFNVHQEWRVADHAVV